MQADHQRAHSLAAVPVLAYLVLTAAVGYFATTWLMVRVSPVLSTSQLNVVPVDPEPAQRANLPSRW